MDNYYQEGIPNTAHRSLKELLQANYIIILFVIAILLLIIVFIFLIIISFSSTNQNVTSKITPSPTRIILKKNFLVNPLERSEIGKTKEEEVLESYTIKSKTSYGNETIYKIESAIPNELDEVRVEKGIVVFERVNTDTVTLTQLTRLDEVIKKFGDPELVIDKVGPHGWYTSLYVFSSNGFAVFANRYTNSVYEVQRFLPMSIDDYKNKYPEFFQPAPTPIGEKP